METLEQTQSFWNLIEPDVRLAVMDGNKYAGQYDVDKAGKLLKKTRAAIHRWNTEATGDLEKPRQFLATCGSLFNAITNDSYLSGDQAETFAMLRLLQKQNLLGKNPFDSASAKDQRISLGLAIGFGHNDFLNVLHQVFKDNFSAYFASVWEHLDSEQQKGVDFSLKNIEGAMQKNPAVTAFIRGEPLK